MSIGPIGFVPPILLFMVLITFFLFCFYNLFFCSAFSSLISYSIYFFSFLFDVISGVFVVVIILARVFLIVNIFLKLFSNILIIIFYSIYCAYNYFSSQISAGRNICRSKKTSLLSECSSCRHLKRSFIVFICVLPEAWSSIHFPYVSFPAPLPVSWCVLPAGSA